MWVVAMAVAGCLFVIPRQQNSDWQTMMLAGMEPRSGAAFIDDSGSEFAVTDYAAQSVPGESLMADRGDGGSVWCDCRRAGAVVLRFGKHVGMLRKHPRPTVYAVVGPIRRGKRRIERYPEAAI